MLSALLPFGFTLWLGLYLLARGSGDLRLRYAGLGLCAYALSVVTAALGGELPLHLGWSLAFLPALFWTPTLLLLPEDLPQRARLSRLWLYSVLPLTTLLFGLSVVGGWLEPGGLLARAGLWALGGVTFAPLLAAFGVSVSRYRRSRSAQPLGPLLIVTLFFVLGLGLLLLPLEWFPRNLTLLALGVDLLMLGAALAYYDAFEQGETLLPDLRRSGLATLAAALVFGLPVAFVLGFEASSPALRMLLFVTVALAIALQTFHLPGADRPPRFCRSTEPGAGTPRPASGLKRPAPGQRRARLAG